MGPKGTELGGRANSRTSGSEPSGSGSGPWFGWRGENAFPRGELREHRLSLKAWRELALRASQMGSWLQTLSVALLLSPRVAPRR